MTEAQVLQPSMAPLVATRAPHQNPVASADHKSGLHTKPLGRPEAMEKAREVEEGDASARQQ